MNNNYQNMNPNTNLNDYLNSTQGQVQNQNQPVVNNNVPNNVPNTVPNPVPANPAPNQMPMNQAPKKNNTMMIVIIIVAILLVGVGGFVVYKAFFNESSTTSSESGTDVVVDEDEKDNEDKEEKIREYSEYNNYKLKMNVTAGYLGYTVTADSDALVDVKNNTDYVETKTSSAGEVTYSYAYDDYAAGVSYSSEDKVTWYKSETSGTESVNLDDLIEKINNKSSDVTYLGNGEYEVEMKVEEAGAVYGSVPVEVKVTDGYITKLVYDFTTIYASLGYSKYVITMELSDFNNSGDVVIPANVINSATAEVDDYEF